MIVHSQRTIMHRARCHANAIEIDPGDVCLSLSPPASFGGINGLLTFAIAGAATRFLDLRREGFAGLQAIMQSQKITSLRASPSVFRALGRLPGVSNSLASLKNVTVYGEPLLRSDVSLLRAVLPQSATIFAGYGATEAGGMGWFPSADDDFDPIRAPAGTLYPFVDATILNEDGRSCQPDEIGELVLRSEYCALGEWHDGRVVATDQLFSDTTEPARRIYRTGDMARMTADGVFVVLDRKDRMLKLNGQRIEPAEIETTIRLSEDVMDCVVVASARKTLVVLTAYVVLRNGALPTAMDDIGRMVRQALPSVMVPSRFVAIEEIPLLSNGKADLAALEETKL
jgi:acyl-coenzyme A synthetase/AMP-(fatty) acid ligase